MIDIAILTPDPAAEGDHALWRSALARLQAILSAHGMTAHPEPWTGHVDDASGLRRYAHVLPLLAWAYHHDHARWLRACATWRSAAVAMSNPAPMLAWNSDKRYLLELARQGVATPATAWTPRLTREGLEAFFRDTGAQELVVKPSVSGGAWKTCRVRRDAAFDPALLGDAPDGGMLLQPYLPTIERAGETSLLFFGGVLGHAVNKRPATGDFRVQEEFGGHYTLLHAAPAAAVALAEQVLAALDAQPLYARIDVVPDRDGRWLLMEAELIEPDLYLGLDPQGGDAFARALLATIHRR